MIEKPEVLATIIYQIPEAIRNEKLSHSKLYGLVPCELGTVWQESLTSYTNRLAGLHHVSPQQFIAQEIVPRLSHSYSRKQLAAFSWSGAMKIDGNGPFAREWASILGDLTKRSDLHLLTSQYWVGDLPPEQLLREKPAWCPACLAEWKDQAMPIYEPMMWAFQAVTLCMKHHRKLEDQCPHCKRRQPLIRSEATLDHCVRCKTWLGLPASGSESETSETIEWQRWVAAALEELRCVMVASALPSWEQFFTNLSASCEARGEQSRLAQLAGLARGQLARWLNRSQTPILGSILEFWYVCNLTPLQVFLGHIAPLRKVIVEGKPCHTPRARRPRHPVDRGRCQELIQAVLDGREEPLGYVQIAARLGYNSSALRYYFPQECALLSQQIKEQRRQRKEQRLARVQEEVRQATLAIHAQGIYPSQNKVADLLADPNLLFQPEAKATWRVLCQELGWDRRRMPPRYY